MKPAGGEGCSSGRDHRHTGEQPSATNAANRNSFHP